ncbi:hypothetical protein IAQ67_28335 (plasmid) [Paenibacillus peoriae]|uniref:DUF3168 domain-containing protein n=1 Tax=Paenibacillus peoriae TaxID=59893 RepID=A0A7H0YH69_9BACL|nr:hypothetical protein [Paenibacillus peoriae]QNR70427.1 hypothetical protein IAQ67_28335 [Paenibacillus peoriae]
MALIRMSDLYAQIHTVLREDKILQDLMGLDGSLLQAAIRIQKRRKPTGDIQGNLPLISFYTDPGMREEENYLVYHSPFFFDIYVQDGDEEKAVEIADRINDLFDEKFLAIPCGSSLRSEFVTMGEMETDRENTYKFFTHVLFNTAIEG